MDIGLANIVVSGWEKTDRIIYGFPPGSLLSICIFMDNLWLLRSYR
jgi:hypothetical protein